MSVAVGLELTFGDDAGMARLRAGDRLEDDLQRLVSRFRTARPRGRGTADVAIEDLLMNLAELATWPYPENVIWEPNLAALARETTQDAQAAAARLAATGREAASAAPEDVPRRLGPGWVGSLTSFQLRDIAKLLSLNHGANFSVPGAGKTRVGLAVFEALRHAGEVKRLLIVGPKSCYEAWQYENTECLTSPLHMEVLHPPINPAADAMIVNYERLQPSLSTLARWLSVQPSMLILDEAHRMKLGADGMYGSACMALGPRARRRLILTGTPAPNTAKDLESLLGFVWPGYGRQLVAKAVAGGDLAHASKALRPLFTRTTKNELGLPPVSISQRAIELPPLHREIYDSLIGMYSPRTASRDDFETLGRIAIYLLMAAISPSLLAVGTTRHEPLAYQVPPLAIPEGSSLMDLMRDLPSYEMSPKYREALAIVASNAQADRKTLVWSTFVRSVNTLEQILKEFSPAVVHGGTTDREAEIERFRRDPQCMVLLSTPATLGEAISLHHACQIGRAHV